MTPCTYDYDNHQLEAVIVDGVKWFNAISMLKCMGYKYSARKNSSNGRAYKLIEMIPDAEKTKIKTHWYISVQGVLWLKQEIEQTKNIKDRDIKSRFFAWFIRMFTRDGRENIIMNTPEDLARLLDDQIEVNDKLRAQLKQVTLERDDAYDTINKLRHSTVDDQSEQIKRLKAERRENYKMIHSLTMRLLGEDTDV